MLNSITSIDFNEAINEVKAERMATTVPETKPLGDFGVCVTVNISLPEFKRTDKRVSKQMAQMNNANAKHVQGRKSLLDMSELDALREAKSAIYRARDIYGTPMGDNAYFIPNAYLIDAKNELESIAYEYNEPLKRGFIVAYPQGVARAQLNTEGLGDLFDPSLYPSVESLESKIGARITWTELPSNHPLESAHRSAQQIFAEEFSSNADNQRNYLMQKLVCDRLLKPLQAMSKNLVTKDDGKPVGFRTTMIDNVMDIARLLKDCNVTEDPRVEQIRQDITNALRGQTIDGLKTSETARIKTKAEVDKIIDQIPTLGF